MITELEIQEKENQYREYIKEHTDNVKKAWSEMLNNAECTKIITDLFSATFSTAQWISMMTNNINDHDSSKYSVEEFDAYRKYYFSVNDEEKNKEELDKAWEHHYRVNLHHWDGWVKIYDMNSMPYSAVIEMVCDWMAMSYKFGGTALSWYEDNKSKIQLGNAQRNLVETILHTLYK